ncbi:MAG: twin-arginine translocation signal domain-containing protein, partial [Melioribacteraceae bacterium]
MTGKQIVVKFEPDINLHYSIIKEIIFQEVKMANQSRRDFLKTAALVGTTVAGLSSKTKAAPKNVLSEDRMGVLVDTTVCIGCRKCEWACKTAHNLETTPLATYDDRSVFETR